MDTHAEQRRVALVGPTHPAPGGIVHFTDGLARALADRGPTMVVGWTRRFPARLYPGTVTDEVSATAISATGEAVLDLLDPRSWRAAARRIREFDADLAVLQWWHPMHAPVVRSIVRRLRRADIPVVVICHNVEPHETNRLWRRLTAHALRGADALLVHAGSVRLDAERIVPGAPVIDGFLPIFGNVANSMSPATAREIDRVRTRADATGRPLLLTFGYVRPYKGVLDAIAAMRLVTTDAALLVAGECWEEPERYTGAVAAADVEDRVTLDFRYVTNDEIPALFAAADAVVLPYRTATQSAVAGLAFAFDRPVVATDAGGLAELIEDDVTGAIAPAGDPTAHAAAIDRVLADGRDWTPAIRAARERLSWSRYVDLLDPALARRAADRDAATHAMLEPGQRRAKAAKIIRIVEREHPLAGARVLDVGTGSGTIAAVLASAVGPSGDVTSVDVADVRVERDGYAFVRASGTALPFPDGSFDVVVSNHAIEHVGDATSQRDHLAEIARVLVPGGLAYVAAPHRWRLVENHYRLPLLSWMPRRLADRYVAATRRGERYDCTLVTRSGLRRMIAASGLVARDATADLVEATAALDSGIAARLMRARAARLLVRGPALPSVAVVATKPRVG